MLKSIVCVNIGNLKKILNESECLYACGSVFWVGGGIANFPTRIAVYLNRLPLGFGNNG